jgi:formylglycine-generating enzyme required for sulfatase activity
MPEDGRLLGEFRLGREIGRGAMAVVHEATQIRMRRPVALKVLHEAFAGEPKAVRRFLREAEAAGSLQHPNIVTAHDRGQADGVPFIVMELVEGPTLAEVIRHIRGDPPRAEDRRHLLEGLPGPDTSIAERIAFAMDIGAQLADALHHAHENGVVHRDVKPSNILLEDGRPKLTDFGLADVMWSSGLTATGERLGTPAYMSPEQALGKDVDLRTDVYSLAATIYEIVTLRRCFECTTLQDYFRQIPVTEPPPLRQIVPGAPRDLETILARAMQKDAARRYATAADFAMDLRNLARGDPIAARPDGAVRKTTRVVKKRPKTALVLAMLLVVACAAWVTASLWPIDGARITVTVRGGGEYPVKLVPLDLAGSPLRNEAIALGNTGDVEDEIVPAGEYFLVVGGNGACAEVPVSLQEKQSHTFAVPIRTNDDLKAEEMIEVPGGRYPIPIGRRSKPGEVSLPAFLLDKTEVSVGDYMRYFRANDVEVPTLWKKYRIPTEEYYSKPVRGLTLFEMEAYARWVGKRLPLEAEWVVAFMGVGDRPPGGCVAKPSLRNVDDPGIDRTELGFFHLYGNLKERTGTWMVTTTTLPDGSRRDTRDGSTVLLGACFSYEPHSTAPTWTTVTPTDTNSYVGFRCARTVAP